MASDSGKRLLLNVLLKGLADATRRNDRSTAERYRRRLRLAVEQVADEPVQDALKRVLLVSGLWIKAAEVDRDETAQQMLKLIDRGLGRSHRDKLFFVTFDSTRPGLPLPGPRRLLGEGQEPGSACREVRGGRGLESKASATSCAC
jgi:hypothetical protein